MHHTEAFRDQPYERIGDRTEENQQEYIRLELYYQPIRPDIYRTVQK